MLLVHAAALALTAPSRLPDGRRAHVSMAAPAFSPRLVLSEVLLKVQRFLDPELELHSLPQRDIVQSEGDIEAVAANFPEKYRELFLGWYKGYAEQVTAPAPRGPGLSEAECLTIFNRIVDRILLMSRQPYDFQSRHEMIEAPYNYFEFGQEYISPLINWGASCLRHPQRWIEARDAVERGENVVLLANHQSEADAAFLPLLFGRSGAQWERFGRSVYYVAGDRVVGDPLAQPFSMGRNLFCVYSKKYIADEADAAVRAAKTKQNKRTVLEMGKALKQGGMLIWVAPSGGRDRPDETSGRPTPAAWDPAVVDMFRSLGSKSGVPTTLYPMAMATYAIMPPPDGRNKALGEARVTKYSGCALSLGEGVDLAEDAAWRARDDDPKAALCGHLFEQVCAEYDAIEGVMEGFHDGTPIVPTDSVQPWVTGALEQNKEASLQAVA